MLIGFSQNTSIPTSSPRNPMELQPFDRWTNHDPNWKFCTFQKSLGAQNYPKVLPETMCLLVAPYPYVNPTSTLRRWQGANFRSSVAVDQRRSKRKSKDNLFDSWASGPQANSLRHPYVNLTSTLRKPYEHEGSY